MSTWNPHIIHRRLQRYRPDKLDELISDPMIEEIRARIKTFHDTLKIARKMAPKRMPLAYRLSPVTAMIPRDSLEMQKFGGLPNLWHDYFAKAFRTRAEEGSRVVHWTPEEYVDSKWPRCHCCFKPMVFLGQVEIMSWLQAIHALTVVKEKVNHECFWKSGVGCKKVIGEHLSHRTWLYFWYCDGNHFDQPNADCACVIERRFQYTPRDLRGWRPKKGKKAWVRAELNSTEHTLRRSARGAAPFSKRVYMRALRAFIKTHKVAVLKPERIDGYDLGFDFDPENPDHTNSRFSERLYDLEEKPPFKETGNFQLFGRPRSQQTERRYICQCRWPKPHVMAPLLSWNHREHDLTHQMYVCLACSPQEGRMLHGKMDISCT